MEDNFPITNIPLIFTQYRTRILEESGRQWFHPQNHEGNAAVVQAVESGRDAIDKPEAVISSTFHSSASSREDVSPPQVLQVERDANGVSHTQDYEHPDPWEDSPAESLKQPTPRLTAQYAEVHKGEVSHQARASEPGSVPLSEGASLRTPQVIVDSATNLETVHSPEQAKSHPSCNVNLFPFNQADPEEAGDGQYDLTEFDNGEIEVPPVAVRDSRQAKFEKVSLSQEKGLEGSLTEPRDVEPGDENAPKLSKNNRPKPASAEIAKFRLRNCL